MAKAIKLRRRTRRDASLTAASAPVTSAKSLKTPLSKASRDGNWQDRAWDYVELVGELAYYVSWRSASVSRCRLIASDLDEDGVPTGTTENARVSAIVKEIGGRAQSQMLARVTALLTVPGEHWIGVITRDPEREERTDGLPVTGDAPETEWVVMSREEVARKSEDIELSLPDGTKHTFNAEVDVLFRVWNPHPRNAFEATSPVRTAQTALNEIVRATATIDKAGQSRLIGNGVLFVPQEMSLPSQQAPTATPPGGVPAVDPTAAWEPASSQDLTDLLYQVAEAAVEDPSSMAAFLPVIASVPGEWTKNVAHIKFDSEVSERAIETRDKALRRLAMALDVTPERLTGLGASTNHWSAWLLAEEDVKLHIAPVLETLCSALTREVLATTLAAEGIDPSGYAVWYDTTALTQDPDRKDEAKDAHDRGAMRNDAYLEHLGFDPSEGYDLTSVEGWQQFAQDKVTADPNLIPMLAPLLGDAVAGIKAPALPAPAETGGDAIDAETEDPLPESEPESGPPQEIEAAAFAMIDTLALRALELAAKRRRTRQTATDFRGLTFPEIHRRLGKVPHGDVDRLIGGWDAAVAWESATAVTGMSREDLSRMVEEQVRMVLAGRP